MRCPYLVEGYIFSCTSEGTPYVPSLSRLRKSCSNESHPECPFFGRKRVVQFGLWEK